MLVLQKQIPEQVPLLVVVVLELKPVDKWQLFQPSRPSTPSQAATVADSPVVMNVYEPAPRL